MSFFRFDSKFFAFSGRMFEKDEDDTSAEDDELPGATGASLSLADESCPCAETCACDRGAPSPDMRMGFRPTRSQGVRA